MTWPKVPLKRLVDPSRPITYGIVQAGPDYDGGIPYIRPVDMTDAEGVTSVEGLLRTSPEIASAYKRSRIQSGDIVLSIGPSFGKVMIVPPELDGANLTQGTARLAPAPGVDTRYLYWALQTSLVRQFWESVVGGATFRALNLGPLSMTPTPLPSSDYQRAIATFLDRESVRTDRILRILSGTKGHLSDSLCGLLVEKRQALITAAVTGHLEVKQIA